MARVGRLMLDKGSVNGGQVVPAEAVERIAAGGDLKPFAKADYPLRC